MEEEEVILAVPDGNDRTHGMAFTVKISIANKMAELLVEFLIMLQLALSKGQCAIVICAYVLTLYPAEEAKDRFYITLDNVI
ncbi:Hypothetical predicted protein [Octopus vulgaris]|uniref:Uncharacterized protein n=1 Tax=Octopus vulgaris TaxID=6645 RepID=A0AA36BHR1_OCTVU|nr:Hypothetical predicted protein [Octopus vulgaris]